MTALAQTRSVRKVVASHMNYVELQEGEDYSTMPAQLSVSKEIVEGLKKIRHTNLNVKLVDYSEKGNFFILLNYLQKKA